MGVQGQPKKSLKEIIAEEYRKCALDPIYFMKKYCIIQHPVRGKIPFHLFPFQEDCLTDFKENRLNIILKSRQLGLSTLSAGFILWKMLFNQDFNALVIATKITVAKGDGIGPEIMDATLEIILEAGAKIEIEEIEVGEKVYLSGNTSGIAASSWDIIRRNKIFLKRII